MRKGNSVKGRLNPATMGALKNNLGWSFLILCIHSGSPSARHLILGIKQMPRISIANAHTGGVMFLLVCSLNLLMPLPTNISIRLSNSANRSQGVPQQHNSANQGS